MSSDFKNESGRAAWFASVIEMAIEMEVDWLMPESCDDRAVRSAYNEGQEAKEFIDGIIESVCE